MSRVHEAWTLLSDALARGVDGSNVLDNFGHLSFELERWDAAADAYGRAAARAPGSLSLRRLQGLALSHAGPQHLGAAAALLEAVRRAGAADVGTLFSLAKVYESLGRITDAGGVYNEMLTREPEHVGARLNIAALHHGFGNIEDALTQYRMLVARPLSEVPLDMMRMALTDYALALYERGECGEAVRLFERELALAGDDATREDVATTHAHVLRARRAVCDWSDADGLWRVLAAETREFLAAGNTTPVLPFETLLIEMPPRLRREIATRHALEWWRARVRTAPEGGGGGGGGDAAAAASGFAVPQRRQRQQRRCPDLVLGYMSYDWAAHPTAHMGEGNFVNRGACTRAVALSYGRDDGSEYRRRIEAAAEPFVNLAAASFEEAVAAIRGARIDVLFDMQGHTRGAREQILAARPAPIAVNYLVYPGTSGAPYIDYVVADAVVVPPEHAPGYTERLLLLPSMYQVNYYAPGTASLADAALRSVLDAAAGGGGGGARGVVRAAHGLPASPARVVFANMNKIDKLEPATFAVRGVVCVCVQSSVRVRVHARSCLRVAAWRVAVRRLTSCCGIDSCTMHWI
jgi:predicted O-linked N-acetylglucosamine transferase (SPINDLY family)